MTDREYDFALVLAGVTELSPDVEDALFEAGCGDATISLRSGRTFLNFSRTAGSLKDAILSAIRDIKKANIGAEVLRVDACNLVSQADMARRIGRSRQLVHQYITGARGPGDFPPPVSDITGGTPLWDWSEVTRWLRQNDMIKEDIFCEAQEVAAINSVLDYERQRRLNPALSEEAIRSIEDGQAAST